MNTYDYERMKESTRLVLNEMSGAAWSTGADFEHDHDPIAGEMRFVDPAIEYFDGDTWIVIIPDINGLLRFFPETTRLQQLVDFLWEDVVFEETDPGDGQIWLLPD